MEALCHPHAAHVSGWQRSSKRDGHCDKCNLRARPHFVHGLFFCSALCRGVCVCLVKHMCTEVCAGPLPLASSALGCVLQASSMCAPILMLEDVVRHQAVLMNLRAT